VRTKIFICLAAVLLLGAWLGRPAFAQGSQAQGTLDPIPPEVVKALLAENWQQVADLLPDEICNKSPVARLIKGHACLALNRNNESLCLFLRTKKAEDLQQWFSWTSELGKRNQGGVANYLQGDALAREQQWKQAMEAFDLSIKQGASKPLALQARAVVHAALAEWDAAREDLIASVDGDPLVSDLFASRGAYILQRATDPQKALEFYERALKLSPDSVIALNGRGCARMILRQWEEARRDLELAVKLASACGSELSVMPSINLDTLVKTFNKASNDALAQVAGIDPGMSITEKMDRINTMPVGQQQLALDLLNNAANWNRTIAGNFLIPKVEMGIAGGIKGSIMGPQPFLEGKMNLSWDVRATSTYNLGQQTELLSAMKGNNPQMSPNRIDNLSSFLLLHTPTYGFIGRPGGVSTKEIGSEPPEGGKWDIVTIYGLLYDINKIEK
jgi:tetratricopeptide (TPR) repeat protein